MPFYDESGALLRSVVKTAEISWFHLGYHADCYVFWLLEECGAAVSDYEEARDILNNAFVERALFDHSIWQYMSKRKREK